MLITYQARDGVCVARAAVLEGESERADFYPCGKNSNIPGVLNLGGVYEIDTVFWVPAGDEISLMLAAASSVVDIMGGQALYWTVSLDSVYLYADAWSMLQEEGDNIDQLYEDLSGLNFDSWVWIKVQLDFPASTLKVGVSEDITAPEEPTGWAVEFDASELDVPYCPFTPVLRLALSDPTYIDIKSYRITRIG